MVITLLKNTLKLNKMKTLKILDWLLPVSMAILTLVLPVSIFYGLLIGTLGVVCLYISHKINDNVIIRILYGIIIVIFYGFSIGILCIDYVIR